MKLRFSFFIWLIFNLVTFSQEKVTFSFAKIPLSEALVIIENSCNVHFSYQDELIKDKIVYLKIKNKKLHKILTFLENKLAIKFQKISANNYIILKQIKTIKDIQQLDEVLVSDYLTIGITKKRNAYKLNLKKLAILPGLVGTDIIESIQLLPGVCSPNDTATDLVVRGGTNGQNRIIWDGINSYHNGHLFGMVAAFNPIMANKVSFYNKGTHPKFGERISSVLNIETDAKITTKTKATFNLDGIAAGFYLNTPIIPNKLSVQTAIRRSYTELHKSVTFNNYTAKVFKNTNIQDDNNSENDFYFIDYNLKLNYKPSKNNQFYFSAFNIKNDLDYFKNDLETLKNYNNLLKINNEGYSLKWIYKWNTNTTQEILGSFSKYKFLYHNILKENENLISDFNKQNLIYDTAINTLITIKTNKKNKLQLGYQYNDKDVSYVFKQKTSNLSLDLDSNQSLIKTHAFYTNYVLNSKTFTLEGGFRVNYFSELDKFKIEPRFILSKKLPNNFKIQLTGEVKNQIINQIDETIFSNFLLEDKLWRLANGTTHPIITSQQISAGILYNNNGWSLDLDFYNKQIKGLASLSLGFLNPLDNSTHIGKQKIFGIDLYVKKRFNKLQTWLSYTFNNAKNKFEGINNENYFIANTAIKHNASLSFTYKLDKLSFGLGFNAHSGKPYTKGIQQNEDIIFDKINTENLPFYHRLDFSSTYNFSFNKKNNLNGKIGLSIRNLYNQENLIASKYVGNNNINDPIKLINRYSLGVTSNILFKINW